MKVLAVENYRGTGLGQVGAALAEAGAEVDIRRPYLGEDLPANAAGHDAIVILGGGQNALADDAHPYFPALLDLARDFETRDRAALGICLGSQLLARAFGGTNLIGTAREFAWCEVRLSEEGASDPLFAGLPGAFPIFQWHDDTFTLPPGAKHLASSPIAENQAFRVGRAAYGIQFHFEADRPLVRRWTDDNRDYLAERQPDWPGRMEEEAARFGPAADSAGLAVARAWVSLI
jgi:GMP synthase-like glutamine amidotransferase